MRQRRESAGPTAFLLGPLAAAARTPLELLLQGGGLRLLLLEGGLQLHNTQRSLVVPLRTLAAAATACRSTDSGVTSWG